MPLPTSESEREDVIDILRRAAHIVASADLGDPLEPVAFRIVVETLMQESKGDRGAIQPSPRGKAEGLDGVAINEFLAVLAVRSHTDRLVAIAYYLLRSEGQLTFNVRHLQEGYTLAREPKPKNFAAIAGRCASRGFFAETGAKLDGLKEWQITKTGEAHIEQLMSRSSEG